MASTGALSADASDDDLTTSLPLPMGSRDFLAALERDRLGGVCLPVLVLSSAAMRGGARVRRLASLSLSQPRIFVLLVLRSVCVVLIGARR